MKKAIFVLLILTAHYFASAQQAQPQQTAQAQDMEAPYKKFPTIPPFNLLKVDSATYLTKEDIRKHHKTMIMFFSPDCDHCRRQTDSLMAAADKFKDIEIVMATYQPFGEMKDFNERYHLADHPNFKIGRDEKFFLVPYYRIHNLPYLALYDKKGDLITTFEGTQKTSTLLNAFDQKKAEE